jgi:tetratricopeptide (TPR) repeat protein
MRSYSSIVNRHSSIAIVLMIVPLCVCLGAGTPIGAQQAHPPADLQVETAPGIGAPLLPRNAEVERALAARQWDRAEQLLVAAIEREPKSAQLLKVLGHVFLMDRKPLNAAIALKKAEALGPLDNEARFRLALAYVALHRGDWARPELERLTALDPTNVVYEYWLGRLDYDAGRYAAAVERLQHVVSRDPGFLRAYDNLGLCYEALNLADQAIPMYRQAIALNRNVPQKSPWPPLNLGILLRHRGEVAEAEALFREAIGYDGAFAQAHYQLGVVLEQQDRPDDAASELTRAADADPSYAEPHYALARIYRRQGRKADADRALATFQRLHDSQREGRPQ